MVTPTNEDGAELSDDDLDHGALTEQCGCNSHRTC